MRREVGGNVLRWISRSHEDRLLKLTKSARWTCPSESSSTLSGLMSRCTMPCWCMYRTAHPNSAIQNRTASSVNVFLEIWNRRSPPFIRSTTMYLCSVSTDIPHGHLATTYKYSMSWKLYRRLHRKGWLRCSSMRRSRMIFRTLSDRTTVTRRQHRVPRAGSRQVCAARRRSMAGVGRPTFILPDVL